MKSTIGVHTPRNLFLRQPKPLHWINLTKQGFNAISSNESLGLYHKTYNGGNLRGGAATHRSGNSSKRQLIEAATHRTPLGGPFLRKIFM
jgi:hypothetical protein